MLEPVSFSGHQGQNSLSVYFGFDFVNLNLIFVSFQHPNFAFSFDFLNLYQTICIFSESDSTFGFFGVFEPV